jgi:hypothetical protein
VYGTVLEWILDAQRSAGNLNRVGLHLRVIEESEKRGGHEECQDQNDPNDLRVEAKTVRHPVCGRLGGVPPSYGG